MWKYDVFEVSENTAHFRIMPKPKNTTDINTLHVPVKALNLRMPHLFVRGLYEGHLLFCLKIARPTIEF